MEFLAGLGGAFVIFVVLVPPMVVISDHPWTDPDLSDLATTSAMAVIAWVVFLVLSGMIVSAIGFPIALGLATLLRPVRSPVVHLVVHAAAALAVCVGLAAVASGFDGISDLGAVLETFWQEAACCVVATVGGWLFAAYLARRADTKRMTEGLVLA